MSELGPEGRSILDAGRDGDDPSDADRARVRAALRRALATGGAIGAAGTAGAGAVAAAAGSKAGALSLGGLAWKLACGALVVGAVVAGVVVLRGSPEVSAPGPSAALASAAGPPELATAVPEASAHGETAPIASGSPSPSALPTAGASATLLPSGEPTAQAAPEPAPPVSSADRRTATPKAPASAAASASSAPAEDPLQAELRRLREAHKALQDEDPNKALALLDERAKGNAGGQLQEERAAARVLALCKAGRGADGRAAAAEFLRTHPRSPLADRVRGACPRSPAPQP